MNDTNKSVKEWEENIINAIRYTYPEDVFPPVAEDERAKDNVMAQAMRDMAPAIASIAVQASQGFVLPKSTSIDKEVLREKLQHYYSPTRDMDSTIRNRLIDALTRELNL